MHVKYQNVNHAFTDLVSGIHTNRYPTERRVNRNSPVLGDTLTIPEPVTVTYLNPTHRVLFNQNRDCNPFFHLYEAMWMLAGRNDVAPLDYYLGGKYSNYSDDKVTANGAYGYRWRHAGGESDWDRKNQRFDYSNPGGNDQLRIIIKHLKERPTDRRCVLQMWNVEDDLLKMKTSRDVCCNLSVVFQMRVPQIGNPFDDIPSTMDGDPVLDMTVFNRSNDLVWGMTGANVVHFSFLQEYMAQMIGVEVGVYNQITTNLHVYLNNWEPDKWLKGLDPKTRTMFDDDVIDYPDGPEWNLVPLVTEPECFDQEVKQFAEQGWGGHSLSISWRNAFFNQVAVPMVMAFHHHTKKEYQKALAFCGLIKSQDWKIACINWMKKRKAKWEKKQGSQQQEEGV